MMTITAENVKEKRVRIQTRKPIMSCVTNQVLFNKTATKYLILPLKLSFEKTGDLFVAFKDDVSGFVVELSSNGSFAINSRPLIRKLETTFKCRKPKFTMISTFELTKFQLKLIPQ